MANRKAGTPVFLAVLVCVAATSCKRTVIQGSMSNQHHHSPGGGQQ